MIGCNEATLEAIEDAEKEQQQQKQQQQEVGAEERRMACLNQG